MKVPKRYLLAIAGAVWGMAGFNIARLGILAYGGYVNVVNIVLSAVVFLLFQVMIFGKMVEKHTRIFLLQYFIRGWEHPYF